MVMGALMRLFPRTTDDQKAEKNYCSVDKGHLPIVLLTTDEIVPQIFAHVTALAEGLYASPPDNDGNQAPFLVFRSRAEDMRLADPPTVSRNREEGHAAAYAKWCAKNGRNAHFMIVSPRAFKDMLLSQKFNVRPACRGLRCLVIDEVDALMHSENLRQINECLKALKDITEQL